MLKSDISLKDDSDLINLTATSLSEPSLLEPEESFAGQTSLYGSITPAPTKQQQQLQLPVLKDILVIPKQRRRPSTIGEFLQEKTSTRFSHKVDKRPSTCGKEGVRHFSTPLPLKIKSLDETVIPVLSPDVSYTDDILNTTFDLGNESSDLSIADTPSLMFGGRFTSPLSVRSFSSPLADLRSKSDVNTDIQLKLSQLSSSEHFGENERQLKRDIIKLQTEINIMKKVKKYRDSGEHDKLIELIDKWKNIAEMASNYMFNQASVKVSRMGGMNEFRKRQKKSKLRKMKYEFDEGMLYRLEEYMESEGFRNLDKYDQNELLDRKAEMEKMSEKIENGDIPLSDDDEEEEDGGDEFTMKDLYKQLGLDYELVFGTDGW